MFESFSFDFTFDWLKMFSAFIALFAIIDPFGSLPIILGLKQRGESIQPTKVVVVSFVLMLAFLFGGELILSFFGVDLKSFAVAGAIILFLMALEMLLDIEIFRYAGPEGTSSLIPLAFPLFAGPGVFTAIITYRVDYSFWELAVAIFLNMVCLYVVLRCTAWIERVLGKAGVYILRKFAGVVILGIAVKILTQNLASIFVSAA
jgi:multiple antibiotic resistance protein